MGANELQQSLLDAMDLLSNKAANSTNAAITIKGEIVEELDSTIHQYKISYGGTVYKDVYAMSGVSYTSSTIVWILIPDGNFDNPKIILGAVSPSATEYVTEEETDLYVPISSNLFGSNSSIELRSWIDESKNVSIDTGSFGLVFSDYLTTYRNFLFTAYIKTEIDKDHQTKGNYGLILNLPFLEQGANGSSNAVWKSYIMDVSTIQGNPYAFNEYQQVNLYYNIDDTLTYDTSRNPFMQAFTQDFGYITSRADIQYDIHIKDIAVKMVDVLNEVDTTGYYLAVVASEGNYFLNGKYVNSKTLKPILKINTKESDVTKWNCYWFVEDSSINITSEGYHILGGLGWKCINKKINITYDTEGNKTFQYVTNNYTYTVSNADVISALRYKCVLTKDEIVVGGSVRLKNLNSSIETKLVSTTGSNTFVAGMGNVSLIARIYYPGVTDATKPTINISTNWQRFDKDGNYLDDILSLEDAKINRYNDKVIVNNKSCYETEIIYPCSKLEQLNTINCTFYGTTTNNGDVVNYNLGTEQIIVTVSEDFTYGITLTGGDVLYKYDADGDSPLVANYDGPISSKITSIEPISFKIFKPDGSELTNIEYLYAYYKWSFPKQSMMKLSGYTSAQLESLEQDDDYYYITGYGQSSINYTILSTYNKKKNNNSILLNISIDGNQISSSANPKFLKDGESGTNGSKYAALITYDGYAYGERDANGKIRKLQFVYIPEIGWKQYDIPSGTLINFDVPKLNVIVYRDGERINSGYSLAWSMFDSTVTDPCIGVTRGELYQIDSWIDPDKIYSNIVECEIKVGESGITNSQEVIYAYYPIEITRLINSQLIGKVIPTLDGGFEEVVYASDGTNPQYDNTNSFVCTNNLYNNDEGDLYDYNWTVSNNLKISSGASSSASIKPITKFDNGVSKNYVKVTLQMSASKRVEVQNKINTLTSQITNTQNLISFYEHNKTHLLDFVAKFDYNRYEGYLNSAKNLLQYRFIMLDLIPSLQQILEDINNYCIEKNIKITDFNYTRYYNNYTSILKTAYKNLYLLGYTKTLGDINDLNDVSILLNEDIITSNYGISVTTQLKSFIQSWTALIENKYQINYTKLVQQSSGQYVLISEYNALHNFDTEIMNFPYDSNLSYLITNHDGNEPIQDFVNLKSQLVALIGKISDETNSLISYSTFIDNLLKAIQTLLIIYQNTEYQNSYYNNLLTNLNAELLDYQQKKTSYEAQLLPAAANYIIHIKPIVMVYNRYEFSHINGWDGNKLYIDENNNEYLLAPQVGAGAKKNGLFTGVIMGVKQFNAQDTQHIGMFGYSDGIQSYFMNAEDGSVIFGKSGAGQMIIDPSQDKAYLYSSNYWVNYNKDGKPNSYTDSNKSNEGMLINLTDAFVHLGSAADGKIYSGLHDDLLSIENGFYLSQNGLSIGTGFTISTNGVSEIIHEESNLGSWKIRTVNSLDEEGNTVSDQCLVSKNGLGIFLDSPSSTIVLGSSTGRIYSGEHYALERTSEGFYLSNKGLSIGTNFTIIADGTATITHNNSNVGQWKLTGEGDNQKLASNSNGILLDAPNSRIILGNGGVGEIYSGTHTTLGSTAEGFYLNNSGLSIHNTIKISTDNGGQIEVGRLTGSRKWIISGNEDNSFIGYNTTTFNTNNTSVYLGTNGISLGHDKFYVTDQGELMSKSGTIGNWTITNTTLESKGIIINSNGDIHGDNWKIQRGDATFDDLTANGTGSIAGWTINSWGLSSPSNSMTIKSEGSMYGPNNAWYIASGGDAKFDNITCTSVWSFGNGNATWSNSGFSFGNGASGFGGLLFTPNGLNLGLGTINLGANPGESGGNVTQGIVYDSSGNVKIGGDIYAKNGYFSGVIKAKAGGTIGGWTIDSEGLTGPNGTQIKPSGVYANGLRVPASTAGFTTGSGDTGFTALELNEKAENALAGLNDKADSGTNCTFQLTANLVNGTVTGWIKTP